MSKDIYGSLNGNNLLDAVPLTAGISGIFSITAICSSNSGICADLVDGIFSLGFHKTAGSPDLIDTSATANGTLTLAGTVVTTAPVPEPSTIVLFGTALAGFAVMRRRRRRAS